jgi:hypothetical protein
MEFPLDVETAYGTISPESLGELTEALFKAGVASAEMSRALGELCVALGDTIQNFKQEMKNWDKRKIRRYKRREREFKRKLKIGREKNA